MASLGSLEGLRERNRLRVIDALRRRGTASRSELARATGLSRTTVTTLVAELQERGLVVEQPPPTRAGRRTRAAADAAAARPVGGHRARHLLRPRHLRVAVADLVLDRARRAARRARRRPRGRAGARRGGRARRRRARRGGHRPRRTWSASGWALSGPIDLDRHRRPTVILPDWAGLSAAEELARRLDLPVAVDNDANLGALAEVSFGAGRGLDRRDLRHGLVRASAPGSSSAAGSTAARPGFAGELGHVCVARRGRRLPLREPRLPRDGRLDRRPARAAAARARRRPHRPRAARAASPPATSRAHAGRQRRRPRDRPCARRSLQLLTRRRSSSAATSVRAGEPLLDRDPRGDRPLRPAGCGAAASR